MSVSGNTGPLGQQRGVGFGIVMYIITFGIYWYVWMWKSHSEIRRQFELETEGRSKGTVWFVLAFFAASPRIAGGAPRIRRPSGRITISDALTS